MLHLTELHRNHANRCFKQREKRKEHFQRIGRSYHSLRRSEREERLTHPLEAVERALTLPKAGNSTSHFGGRKELMRHRRRVAQREKRRTLLRTCASLKLSLTVPRNPSQPISEEQSSFFVEEITEDTEEQKRCRQLLESQCLSRLRRAPGQLYNERISGASNRLQRQIKAVANVAGLSFMTSTKPQHRDMKALKQRKSQRKHLSSRQSAGHVVGIDI